MFLRAGDVWPWHVVLRAMFAPLTVLAGYFIWRVTPPQHSAHDLWYIFVSIGLYFYISAYRWSRMIERRLPEIFPLDQRASILVPLRAEMAQKTSFFLAPFVFVELLLHEATLLVNDTTYHLAIFPGSLYIGALTVFFGGIVLGLIWIRRC